MARTVDFREKAEELRTILQKYNGIPSNKEDSVAYRSVKYYLKTYSNEPEIREVMEEYSLKGSEKDHKDFDINFVKIKEILEERNAMPDRSEEKELYYFVKDFFKKYKDVPEVETLKFQYPGQSYYNITNSDYDKLESSDKKNAIMLLRKELHSCLDLEYVLYVWLRFGFLPAKNTPPMKGISSKIHNYCEQRIRINQEQIEDLFTFSKLMETFNPTLTS